MGVTNAASPTVLCPPSNSAERAVATKALTGAYPAFSWSACSNTVDTDVDYSFTASSLISKAGTIGFHPLDDTLTAAKDAVVTLPIDGTDGFDVAYHFILRQNQVSRRGCYMHLPNSLMSSPKHIALACVFTLQTGPYEYTAA